MRLAEPSKLPALDIEIVKAVTPCLALVAPVGMDEEMQATWFVAAIMALDGYSENEIATAAKEAMRHADHPSKIVPAIVACIEAMPAYARDTGMIRMPRVTPRPTPLPPPEETEQQRRNRRELADMMGNLAKRLSANTGQKI